MLELSPNTLFSTFGWPLEEPISHVQNYIFRDSETPESFAHDIVPSQPDIRALDRSTSLRAYSGSGDVNMAKKLNHNASERDRRKKINTADQMVMEGTYALESEGLNEKLVSLCGKTESLWYKFGLKPGYA
ncbi:unnamed protein product [Dovyalis caffra]|uniref:BHLH domain-containing protein n=1 Tax=Dovyalis caffra TaxID=77055 RepID=A0AAV1RY12_9ROSI|nr:unnamed protein product [Dovyalis caffra]